MNKMLYLLMYDRECGDKIEKEKGIVLVVFSLNTATN